MPDTGAAGAAKVIDRHVEEATGPKLDEAAVVVSGGRGLGEAEKYEMIEELAKLLKGAPGASRAIVDAGWVPYCYQVGQTGKVVKPTVYIAAGISGATQHMVGMKGSKNIIAINKDPEAPIFAIADLGIVGDVHKVLPEAHRGPEGPRLSPSGVAPLNVEVSGTGGSASAGGSERCSGPPVARPGAQSQSSTAVTAQASPSAGSSTARRRRHPVSGS